MNQHHGINPTFSTNTKSLSIFDFSPEASMKSKQVSNEQRFLNICPPFNSFQTLPITQIEQYCQECCHCCFEFKGTVSASWQDWGQLNFPATFSWEMVGGESSLSNLRMTKCSIHYPLPHQWASYQIQQSKYLCTIWIVDTTWSKKYENLRKLLAWLSSIVVIHAPFKAKWPPAKMLVLLWCPL